MKKIICILIFITIVISGCSKQTSRNIDEDLIELAKYDEITLYANNPAEEGIYKGITVKIKDKKVSFPWYNDSESGFNPTINKADINADGKDEIVIVLTTDEGTGICIQELHLLNMEDLSEITGMENPLEVINNNVSSTIAINHGQVSVKVEWNGNIIEKTYKESDAGVWNDNVVFGNTVKYTAYENKVYAFVPGSFSFGGFYEVEAVIEYGPDLKARKITVEDISKESAFEEIKKDMEK